MRTDLEKKTVFYEEELSRRDLQHTNELKNLKKELRDTEAQQVSLKKEIIMLKDKLEKTRRERYNPYNTIIISLYFKMFFIKSLCSVLNDSHVLCLVFLPFLFIVFFIFIFKNHSLTSSQTEREEFETDYKQKYERERVLLTEENKKLSSELDNVSILPLRSCVCFSFFFFIFFLLTFFHLLPYSNLNLELHTILV